MLLAVVLDTRKLRIVASEASRLKDLAMFVAALPAGSCRVLRHIDVGVS